MVDSSGVSHETKGGMRIEDVSATTLDDLEIEFTCLDHGPMRELMRKSGVAQVRSLIERTMNELQEEVRRKQASEVSTKPPPKAPLPTPIPQPTVTGPKVTKAAAALPTTPREVMESQCESGAEKDDDPLPPSLSSALQRLREEPRSVSELQLSNCGICDVHLRPLVEALSQSSCALTTLDLAFNRITDAGVHVLCKGLASGAALELTSLHLGGNRVSVHGMALSQGLKQVRGDILVEWKSQLRGASSMCTVGNVYGESPAAKAGLRAGDSIIAFGPLQHHKFKSVTESIVPIVKESVGKEIDVVVIRLDESSKVHQLALTLVPQAWSGGGLLGCILR